MNVAFLADRDWLDEYLPAYRHLVIGLIDESIPITQILPESLPDHDRVGYGQLFTWSESRWDWLVQRRLLALAEPLRSQGIDVLHIASRQYLQAGLALAGELDAAVVFEVYDEDCLEYVEMLDQSQSQAGLAFLAPGHALYKQTVDLLGDDRAVMLARPGLRPREVHATDTAGPIQCLTATIFRGSATDQENWLASLTKLVRDFPEIMVFVDVAHAREAQAFWKQSRKLDLSSHLTLASRPLGRFDMVTQADALIVPAAAGRPRGIVMQSMLAGLPVIAVPDPCVDYYEPGTTCQLVDDRSVTGWSSAIRELMADPVGARALGRSAATWAEQHFRVSTYVSAVIQAYHAATGEAIPFNPGAADTDDDEIDDTDD